METLLEEMEKRILNKNGSASLLIASATFALMLFVSAFYDASQIILAKNRVAAAAEQIARCVVPTDSDCRIAQSGKGTGYYEWFKKDVAENKVDLYEFAAYEATTYLDRWKLTYDQYQVQKAKLPDLNFEYFSNPYEKLEITPKQFGIKRYNQLAKVNTKITQKYYTRSPFPVFDENFEKATLGSLSQWESRFSNTEFTKLEGSSKWINKDAEGVYDSGFINIPVLDKDAECLEGGDCKTKNTGSSEDWRDGAFIALKAYLYIEDISGGSSASVRIDGKGNEAPGLELRIYNESGELIDYNFNKRKFERESQTYSECLGGRDNITVREKDFVGLNLRGSEGSNGGSSAVCKNDLDNSNNSGSTDGDHSSLYVKRGGKFRVILRYYSTNRKIKIKPYLLYYIDQPRLGSRQINGPVREFVCPKRALSITNNLMSESCSSSLCGYESDSEISSCSIIAESLEEQSFCSLDQIDTKERAFAYQLNNQKQYVETSACAMNNALSNFDKNSICSVNVVDKRTQNLPDRECNLSAPTSRKIDCGDTEYIYGSSEYEEALELCKAKTSIQTFGTHNQSISEKNYTKENEGLMTPAKWENIITPIQKNGLIIEDGKIQRRVTQEKTSNNFVLRRKNSNWRPDDIHFGVTQVANPKYSIVESKIENFKNSYPFNIQSITKIEGILTNNECKKESDFEIIKNFISGIYPEVATEDIYIDYKVTNQGIKKLEGESIARCSEAKSSYSYITERQPVSLGIYGHGEKPANCGDKCYSHILEYSATNPASQINVQPAIAQGIKELSRGNHNLKVNCNDNGCSNVSVSKTNKRADISISHPVALHFPLSTLLGKEYYSITTNNSELLEGK